MKMENLDYMAAKSSQEILEGSIKPDNASNVENIVTKTLGVLQEDGVYAATLYLQSQKDEIAKKISEKLINQTNIINITPIYKLNQPLENCKFVSDSICNNLNNLFLIKELWEKTLIYCRYGAKAYDDKKDSSQETEGESDEKKHEKKEAASGTSRAKEG